VRGNAFRRGNDFPGYNEDTVIAAFEVLFDDHVGAMPGSVFEAPADVVGGCEVRRDAPAVIAIEGFHDDREAESLRGFDRFRDVAYDGAFRDRHSGCGKQGFGQVLVARRLDREIGGAAGDAAADPPLVPALPELDEAMPVQAGNGNVAPLGFID
jgi:hypothetical protein